MDHLDICNRLTEIFVTYIPDNIQTFVRREIGPNMLA